MSSDIINYFKIENYLNSCVLNNLKSSFRERWAKEYNNQWKNGAEGGNLIKENLKKFEGFNQDEINLIEKGNSNKFSISILCDLMLKLNFKNSNEYNNENERIKKIKEINEKVKNCDFKLNLENFNQFKEILIKNNIFENLKQQDEENENEENGANLREFKNEVEANQLFEKGLNCLNNKSFEQAKKSFNHALGFEDISRSIKSQLYYNCGLSKFEQYNRYCCYEGIQNSEFPEDKFSLFEESKNDIYQSIIFKPSWYLPYIQYGKILSKLSNYAMSIQFYKSALSLVEQQQQQQQQQDNKSIQEEINKLIQESMDKLKLKMSLAKENDGKRNFIKENELKMEKLIYLIKENKQQFKSNLTGDFLKKYGIGPTKRAECIKIAENFNLPKQLYVEIEMVNKAYDYYNEGNYSKSLEICQNVVGSYTQYCQAYLNLSNIYRFKIQTSNKKNQTPLNIQYEPKMILLLHLMASTICPIKFSVPQYLSKTYSQSQMDEITENPTIGEIFSFMGLIYQYGLLNEDIDYEKSVYYFKLAIDNFNDKIAFINLGNMYYKGRLPDGKCNQEIAKKIWERGSHVDIQECTDLLKNKFKLSKDKENKSNPQQSQQNTLSVKPIEFKSDNNIYKKIDYFEIESYEFQQSFNYDFNEILNQINQVPAGEQQPKLNRINYILNNCIDFLNEFNNEDQLKQINLTSSNTNKKNKYNNSNNSNNTQEILIKILKPLANSFIVSRELFYLISIPKDRYDQIKEFVNQLLNNDQQQQQQQQSFCSELIKIIKICYLGLNRFDRQLLDSNIEFVNQALKQFKNDKDFIYYSCVFNIYKNDYTNVYCNSSNIIKTIQKDIINTREIFLYFKTLSSNFELFEDNDLSDTFKNQILLDISKDSSDFINYDSKNFESKLSSSSSNNGINQDLNKNKNNSINEFILNSPFIIDFYFLISFSFYLLSINNSNNNNNQNELSNNNNNNNYKISLEYFNLGCDFLNQLKSKFDEKSSDKENQILSKLIYSKRLNYLESILNNLKNLINQ